MLYPVSTFALSNKSRNVARLRHFSPGVICRDSEFTYHMFVGSTEKAVSLTHSSSISRR